jgi:putative component of toxin-antitoxin plasmid stabilization module
MKTKKSPKYSFASLVSGGDKNQQSKDIKEAKEYLEDYRSRYENEEKS